MASISSLKWKSSMHWLFSGLLEARHTHRGKWRWVCDRCLRVGEDWNIWQGTEKGQKDWRRLCRMAGGCGKPEIRGPSWNGGTQARNIAQTIAGGQIFYGELLWDCIFTPSYLLMPYSAVFCNSRLQEWGYDSLSLYTGLVTQYGFAALPTPLPPVTGAFYSAIRRVTSMTSSF